MTARQWIVWRFVEHVSPRLPRLVLASAAAVALLVAAIRGDGGVLVALARAAAELLSK